MEDKQFKLIMEQMKTMQKQLNGMQKQMNNIQEQINRKQEETNKRLDKIDLDHKDLKEGIGVLFIDLTKEVNKNTKGRKIMSKYIDNLYQLVQDR